LKNSEYFNLSLIIIAKLAVLGFVEAANNKTIIAFWFS